MDPLLTSPTLRVTNLPDIFQRRQPIRQKLSWLKQRIAVLASVPLSRCFGSRGDSVFGVLTYHRVVDRVPGFSNPTFNVPPARFRQQLAGLLRRGFTAWPLQKAIDASLEGRAIPRDVFIVTFDDGYENVYRCAYPILKELSIPATVFLSTGYLDSDEPFPNDDWPDAGATGVTPLAWRPLTIDQCREMQAGGLIELGSHTHTHGDFRGNPDFLRVDLARSVSAMRDYFGIDSPTFAFPYGTKSLGFSGTLLSAAAREVGVRCSLTTEEELIPLGSDPFDWGRFTAYEQDTASTLAAKLDGWHGAIRKAWSVVKSPATALRRLTTPRTPSSRSTESPESDDVVPAPAARRKRCQTTT